MAENTSIAWCHHTFNLVWGCETISPGCEHCYAEFFARRTGHDVWGPGKRRRTFGSKHWAAPLAWDYAARQAGVRRRVFCSSMTDWALDDPDVEGARPRMWDLIRNTPDLDWLLLTKRAERIRQCLPENWGPDGYANVWLGVSTENQEWADRRIPELLRVPAAVRFLSAEPLLGPIDLPFGAAGNSIHWVIVGGESGPKHRPMALSWARLIRDRCKSAGVPFFFKQSSGLKPGKGDTLDGVIERAFPR